MVIISLLQVLIRPIIYIQPTEASALKKKIGIVDISVFLIDIQLYFSLHYLLNIVHCCFANLILPTFATLVTSLNKLLIDLQFELLEHCKT